MSRSVRRPVSMAQVAAAAGVSAQTVSRVSNNEPNVVESTRQRVLAAMDELGYAPNRAARALKLGRFNAVGVALFDISATGNIGILEGICHAASDADHAVTLVTMRQQDEMALTDAIQRLMKLSVDAAIVLLERMPVDYHQFTPPPGIRVVLIATIDSELMPVVDADQRGGAIMATEYLLELGHRQVHFVSGPSESLASQTRLDAWREVLRQRGITPPEVLVGDWSAQSGFEAGQKLARNPECTAVFAANDAMAVGVIRGLESTGRKVPEDVSVVGFDDSQAHALPDRGLTTIRQDFHRVGQLAFEQAVKTEESTGNEPRSVVLPVTLIDRGSARRVN